MKIKSLLLGSAAALVAVSGARAADAIIIAEPEPVEYVRVCDAYGAGFFYIPGGETCLKIGGYVRYDIRINKNGWDKNARGQLTVDARSDTEMGTLRSFIALQGNAEGAGTNVSPLTNSLTKSVTIDEAFIELGGLKIGLSYDYFDGNGIGGENDSTGGAQVNMIGYTFAANGFDAGIMVVDDNDSNNAATYGDFTPNVQATVGYAMGPVSARLIGAYDNDTKNYAAKAVVKFAVTDGGSLDIAGMYSDGATYTYSAGEWSVAGSYNQKINDKVAVSVGAQYFGDTNYKVAGNPTAYTIGANVDFTPVTNFLVRGSVQYRSDKNVAGVSTNSTTGYIRFQRSF